MKRTYHQERLEAVALVHAEMQRQDEKWGSQRQQHVFKWHAILSEEVGEAAEASLDLDNATREYEAVRDSDAEQRGDMAALESEVAARSLALECELVQVAAVAVQQIAALRSKRFPS